MHCHPLCKTDGNQENKSFLSFSPDVLHSFYGKPPFVKNPLPMNVIDNSLDCKINSKQNKGKYILYLNMESFNCD